MVSKGRFTTNAVVAPGNRSQRTFFDTNILVYAEDSANPGKQKRAIELIVEHVRARTGVISLQVLGEFFHTVTRKLNLDPRVARAQVEFYSRFHLAEVSLTDVLAATDLHRLYGYSYWDSLLFRTAQQAACPIFLSEDMRHGQSIDGPRIVNPFA